MNIFVKKTMLLLLIIMLKLSTAFNQNLQFSDSLKNLLIYTNSDTVRYKIYADLALEYLYVDVNEAKIYIDKANEIAKNSNNELKLSEIGVLYGILYSAKQQKYIALQHLLKALKLAEKNNNLDLIANASKSIASIYVNLGEPLKAYQYSKKALLALENSKQIVTCPEFKTKKAILHSYLGKAYLALDSTPEAKTYLFSSFSIFKELHDSDNIAYLSNSIGNFYYHNQNIENAKVYYRQGIKYAQKAKNIAWKLTGQLGLAKSLNSCDSNALAKQYIDSVIQLSHKVNIPLYVTDAYQLLANIHASNNEYKEAYNTHKKFKYFNDSIILNNNATEIARLEEQLKFEKQQQLLEKEQELKEYKLYLILTVLFMLILVFVLLFFLQRSKTKKRNIEKKQLSHELVYKNSELTSKVMLMLKQNQHLEEITLKLKQLKLLVTRSNEKKVDDLLKDLKQIQDKNIWIEFEKRFISIHPDFYKKLTQKYPDLTLNEKRICAFIKMKLNTKEIAYFTQNKTNTIKVAKYRLRKRLNITNGSTSLESFLENF